MGRRHVFRVLAIYVAVGWGFTEIVQGVVEQVGAPQAIATFVTIAFIVGFPIVLFLAWMFDVDRHGVHRVPTRGKGQLLVSLAIAILLAASYGIYNTSTCHVANGHLLMSRLTTLSWRWCHSKTFRRVRSSNFSARPSPKTC